jgi:polyphosphate kinase
MYGAQGFKCHSKVCQVTYHTPAGFMQVGVLATGNFNEATAKTYSDLVLLTAHAGINRDIDEFFKNLSLANLDGTYHYLGVAPHGLKPLILAGIERERKRAEAGEPARIVMKMNSLTDRDIIDALAISSQAGVEIDLIVRGICCLLPGVAGKTTGITVHSIVGRYLEHARLYTFGVGADLMYASSADMMTRNTERRVELAFPILDETCRQKVLSYLELELADNVKGRLLSPAGAWERIPVEPGEAAINAQEELMRAAGIAAATVATHRSHAPAAPGALGAPGSTAPQVNPQNKLHRPLNASTSVAAEASMATASTSHVAPTTLPAPTPEKYHELPPSRGGTPPPTGVALEGVGRLTGWARCVRAATLCLFGGTDAALKREAKREERARRKRGE